MTTSTALDLAVEFIFTGATFMLGFMQASGGLVRTSRASSGRPTSTAR